MSLTYVYLVSLLTAAISYGFGFFMGYGFGRDVGLMIGEHRERKKWKRIGFKE